MNKKDNPTIYKLQVRIYKEQVNKLNEIAKNFYEGNVSKLIREAINEFIDKRG